MGLVEKTEDQNREMKARLERELLQKEKQDSSGAANLADEELLQIFSSMPTPSESVHMVVDSEPEELLSNEPEPDVSAGNKSTVTEIGGGPSKGRSIVWDHYTPYPDQANPELKRYRCNYCPKNYAYT
ncbi:hypothetical protein OROMI_020828 [Orobanche minor]